jgi:hypothetical protein
MKDDKIRMILWYDGMSDDGITTTTTEMMQCHGEVGIGRIIEWVAD